MSESYIDLSRADQIEALNVASAKTGIPLYLLEKDVWVVWVLSVLYESKIAQHITFKGGTSLSKAYRVIDRFSEDIDLTIDIRQLIPDAPVEVDVVAKSRAAARRLADNVRKQLPPYLEENVIPILTKAINRSKLDATIEFDKSRSGDIYVRYDPLVPGAEYVASVVKLEFGARSTGNPTEQLPIRCDMERHVDGVEFPTTLPRVMKIERTFWEKATLAHIYCVQAKIPAHRYARHWYDLASIGESDYFGRIKSSPDVAEQVANHKNLFFRERDDNGVNVDYRRVLTSGLRLAPSGSRRNELESDYGKMIDDGLLLEDAMTFTEVMDVCHRMEAELPRP